LRYLDPRANRQEADKDCKRQHITKLRSPLQFWGTPCRVFHAVTYLVAL
jgi:hypothetical protein